MFPYSQLLVSALLATCAFSAPAPASSQPGGVIRQVVTQGINAVFDPKDLSQLVKADYARAAAAKTGSLAGSVGDGSMSSFAAISKNGTTSKAVGSAHATNQAIYYTTGRFFYCSVSCELTLLQRFKLVILR